jgi:ABC-type sugar transport system ATPase subunit
MIQPNLENEIVDYYKKILRVKAPANDFKIRHLSGGNQQKVILGRWLSTSPKILLLDEPTRGIDISAKTEIYHLIRDLVDQGLSLILVSSELPEIVSLADRVLVMRSGTVACTLEGNEITQENIMTKAAA